MPDVLAPMPPKADTPPSKIKAPTKSRAPRLKVETPPAKVETPPPDVPDVPTPPKVPTPAKKRTAAVSRKKPAPEAEAVAVPVHDDDPPIAATEVHTVPPAHENVVIQLNIPTERLNALLHNDLVGCTTTSMDPMPYDPCSQFESSHDVLGVVHGASTHAAQSAEAPDPLQTDNNCFWCCHPVSMVTYGLPIAYDCVRNHFTMFGTFCSLGCCAAYNFEVNSGSDRSWEIYSWIQTLAAQWNMAVPVRPAPSRYLLRMFNGPLDIDAFRQCHSTHQRTYTMNAPPFLHVQPQMEIVNTSFQAHTKGSSADGSAGAVGATASAAPKLFRRRALTDSKKTLDVKMNLTYIEHEGAHEAPVVA